MICTAYSASASSSYSSTVVASQVPQVTLVGAGRVSSIDQRFRF